jgi:hypothetical protein
VGRGDGTAIHRDTVVNGLSEAPHPAFAQSRVFAFSSPLLWGDGDGAVAIPRNRGERAEAGAGRGEEAGRGGQRPR